MECMRLPHSLCNTASPTCWKCQPLLPLCAQFDAGSCIDGRLTSAWNWGSKIEKKPYYHIFKLAGFVGFDGEFKG